MLLPCSSNVDIQLIGFPSRFPSPCSLLLCLLAGLSLFLALRFVIHRHATPTVDRMSSGDKEKRVTETIHVQEKQSSWRLLAWDNLTVSLPITLTAPPSPTMIGRGVGIKPSISFASLSPPPRSSAASQPRTQAVSLQRKGPTFEQPLPAIYQSQEPLSMAKLIMSRHTFRRPGPKSIKRPASAPPTSSRPHLMV